MFIQILYVVLVLCVGAVLGAVIAGYLRIRRHLNGSSKAPENAPQAEQEIRQ
ncbi:MAG TPA: hypothetical protein VG897_07855 [Terriglobales bacterium]|nr:hypothetical protein [Terriglobales bacterium]